MANCVIVLVNWLQFGCFYMCVQVHFMRALSSTFKFHKNRGLPCGIGIHFASILQLMVLCISMLMLFIYLWMPTRSKNTPYECSYPSSSYHTQSTLIFEHIWQDPSPTIHIHMNRHFAVWHFFSFFHSFIGLNKCHKEDMKR